MARLKQLKFDKKKIKALISQVTGYISQESRKALKRKREESAKPRSQTRSLSRPPRDKSGMRDEVVSALEHFHIWHMLVYWSLLGSTKFQQYFFKKKKTCELKGECNEKAIDLQV